MQGDADHLGHEGVGRTPFVGRDLVHVDHGAQADLTQGGGQRRAGVAVTARRWRLARIWILCRTMGSTTGRSATRSNRRALRERQESLAGR